MVLGWLGECRRWEYDVDNSQDLVENKSLILQIQDVELKQNSNRASVTPTCDLMEHRRLCCDDCAKSYSCLPRPERWTILKEHKLELIYFNHRLICGVFSKNSEKCSSWFFFQSPNCRLLSPTTANLTFEKLDKYLIISLITRLKQLFDYWNGCILIFFQSSFKSSLVFRDWQSHKHI